MTPRNTSILVFGALLICSLAVVGRRHFFPSPTAGSPQAASAADWKAIDFGAVRLRTPRDWWEVPPPPKAQTGELRMYAVQDFKSEQIPFAGLAAGSMLIVEDRKPKDRTSLQERFSAEFRKFNDRWYPRRLLGKPRTLNLRGGQCLTYKVEATSIQKCAGPPPGTKLPCVEIALQSYCHSQSGRSYDIRVSLGRHTEGGTPDAKTVERGRVFAQVLRGIEFL